MKNIKELIMNFKKLSSISKIIVVSSTTVITVGVVTGTVLLSSRNNEILVDDQGNFVASRADVLEASKGHKEVELSEERKAYDDKVVKYLDVLTQLKELGIEYGNGITPDEKEIDKALEEANNKLKEEQDKLASKDTEENKEESNSSDSGSSDSGSSQQSAPSAPVEEPSAPSQPSAPSTPSAPAVSSGWRDDIASYVVSYGSTAGRTNVATYVTQDSLDYAYSRVNGWFNGDGSTLAGINADAQSQHAIEGKFFLRLYTLKSITVSGCDKDVIAETVLENTNSPGQVDFYWAKVYYDASTNTSTIYFADGAHSS